MIKRIKGIYIYLLFIGIAFTLIGCGIGEKQKNLDTPEEIMVFAASSLTESFSEIAAQFEKLENGKVKINFNFAGSQVLKTSIENGAKADIFASASTKYMDELKDKNFISNDTLFARNRLVLIKNSKSSYSIKKFGDLSIEGLKIAVGDKSVPVGMYWEQALDAASDNGEIKADERSRIENNIKTKELNVKDVVSKVVLNEVDVGVVYRTDVTKSIEGQVEKIDLPDFQNLYTNYPIAVLKGSEKSTEVQKFYQFLVSDKGKKILKRYNFITDK